MTPDKPVVIITLQGEKPNLPTILLTSHMDVVPVYPVCFMYNIYLIINYYVKYQY